MSEIDRLSNSGLYPALPIGDRRSSKDENQRGQRSDRPADKPVGKTGDTAEPGASPRPPKSSIDEFA